MFYHANSKQSKIKWLVTIKLEIRAKNIQEIKKVTS